MKHALAIAVAVCDGIMAGTFLALLTSADASDLERGWMALVCVVASGSGYAVFRVKGVVEKGSRREVR